MKKRIYFIVAISLLIILTLFFFSSFAQVKKTSEGIDNRNTNYRKIVKAQGWSLPEIQDREFSESAVIKMQDLPITLKLFKPEESPIIELDFYNIRPDGSIILSSRTVEAIYIVAYSYNGKTFCYKTSNVPTSVENGVKVQSGIIYTVYYFDEDGDNTFETMYQTSDLLNIVPDWVKNLKNDR